MSRKSAEMRTVAKRKAKVKQKQLTTGKPVEVCRRHIGIKVVHNGHELYPGAYLIYEIEMSDGRTKIGFGKPISAHHPFDEKFQLVMTTAANLVAYIETQCLKRDVAFAKESW